MANTIFLIALSKNQHYKTNRPPIGFVLLYWVTVTQIERFRSTIKKLYGFHLTYSVKADNF